jgi:hypothetical protein
MSAIQKGRAINMKFIMKIEDARSENLLSFANLLLRSRFIYSAEIKTEINAAMKAITTENSNPRVPKSGKKSSMSDTKTIMNSDMSTLFEKNISTKVN